MPTAVITESSENTASSTTICATVGQNAACTVVPTWRSWPSTRSWISVVALTSRNTPPAIRIRSRQEISKRQNESTGAVSDMTQEMLASRPSRISRASERPMMRARSRFSGGSLSARMAMKIRLSTPSTISSATRVRSPTQTVGSESHSMVTASGSVGAIRFEEQPLDLGELGAGGDLCPVDKSDQLLRATAPEPRLHRDHQRGAELQGDEAIDLVDAVLLQQELAQARLGLR